ncbi:MAG: hypothetical protein V4616_02620 [Bacteroidota bacterium]
MKKILLFGAVAAFALTSSTAFAGGKEKSKKAKTECAAGEKKACCASKTSCTKKTAEATPAKSK